ncbi:AbiV family abortive infection protein [Promicromonospora alba]|uniref:AbiV family abortive infection protein n=1 Tax=Promicromonospora alba TaxID=1616110 RepID=A0ABV9HIL1_9MICO
MAVRVLPDLTPERVEDLLDSLLANADALLTSAVAVLDLGHVALGRSLALLGLEESGKAIAVHERRIQMAFAPEGELFRCTWLDELWASHQKKLEKVHAFLVEERYWFGIEPADPVQNAASLGAVRAWSRRHDRSKQRGFYVDLGKTGNILAPTDLSVEGPLREVIAHVHQIGWQLRLGEHIEGQRQDEREAGSPPLTDEALGRMNGSHATRLPPESQRIVLELIESMKKGTPGEPLNNTAYRFNRPGKDRGSFVNLGKPGYEAETRELLRMADELERNAESGGIAFPDASED